MGNDRAMEDNRRAYGLASESGGMFAKRKSRSFTTLSPRTLMRPRGPKRAPFGMTPLWGREVYLGDIELPGSPNLDWVDSCRYHNPLQYRYRSLFPVPTGVEDFVGQDSATKLEGGPFAGKVFVADDPPNVDRFVSVFEIFARRNRLFHVYLSQCRVVFYVVFLRGRENRWKASWIESSEVFVVKRKLIWFWSRVEKLLDIVLCCHQLYCFAAATSSVWVFQMNDQPEQWTPPIQNVYRSVTNGMVRRLLTSASRRY